MLSDRSYMRDSQARQPANALPWLIAAIVAGFILQNIALRWFDAPGSMENAFALSGAGLRAGKVWTLFTYSFLHSPSNLLHIVGNLLGLYFIGRVLQPMLGSTRFLGLYAGAVVAGGLFWALTNWHAHDYVIGASAGVAGLFIVFACFYPNQPITFLLFFIIPVTIKPKYVAIAAAALDLLGYFFYEVMGAPSPFGFAHSAHLGGMAAGWIYYRFVHEANWSRLTRRGADIELPSWMRKAPKSVATPFHVNVGGSKASLRAEVDRILDKINSQGFGALSADEKRVLDEAKDLLSRR